MTLYSEKENISLRAPNTCSFFYKAIFPYLVALRFGGALPWEEDKDEATFGCQTDKKLR